MYRRLILQSKIKQHAACWSNIRNRRGISLVGVVFVMVVLAGFSVTLTEMMTSKQDSVVNILHSTKTFHIADAGIQYAAKYLQDLADWTTAADSVVNYGGGSFSLTFTGYDAGPPERIDVESAGSFETGSRTIDKTFER